MVMEESPSPQIVGREFVRQYYTLLNKAPIHLHRFYNNVSSFVHGGLDAPDRETAPVIGQKEIHNRIQQLNFRDCHAKISQVDSQATLGNGVVVQVTGELSNGGQPMRRFTQTFVLAMQNPKQYYVHNDIFRYQDFVFNDEDSEWEYSRPEEVSVTASVTTSTPAVLQQPLPAPYFPPPSTLPPLAPLTPLTTHAQINHPTLAPVESISPPPSLAHRLPHHLQKPSAPVATHNGHQEDPQANLSMPLSASDSSCGDVDIVGQEFEVEVEAAMVKQLAASNPPQVQTPTLPVHEPAPVIVNTEPKTYANLVKSGPPGSFAQAMQQTAPATQNASSGRVSSSASRSDQSPAQPQSTTPVTPPAQQRPRIQRQPRSDSITESSSVQGSGNTPPSSSSGPARRYSDSHQLFLGNVPHIATKEELRVMFERFGAIADIRVYNKPAGPPGSAAGPGGRLLPNYAFLTFEDSQSAQNCLNSGPLYFPSEDSEDAHLLNVQEKKSRLSGGGGGGGGGGGRGGGGGGRGGPRPPRPAFSRTPYQPQRR